MKNSPHHDKHLKHQAIKEANAIVNTPEKGVECPGFKKQFDAKEEQLPHKASHQHKKCSKRCSNKDIHDCPESSHVHDNTERRLENAQKRTTDSTAKLNHKLSKHHK